MYVTKIILFIYYITDTDQYMPFPVSELSRVQTQGGSQESERRVY